MWQDCCTSPVRSLVDVKVFQVLQRAINTSKAGPNVSLTSMDPAETSCVFTDDLEWSLNLRRAGSGTYLPPPRALVNEVRYIRVCVATPPPPPQSKIYHERKSTSCLRSHSSTCLVLGHSSRAAEGSPTRNPPPRAPVVCLVTVPVSCLYTAAVLGRGDPPRTPPRARPLVLGHRFCLGLGHSSRAGRETPPGPPPSSTPPRAGSQIYLFIGKKTVLHR